MKLLDELLSLEGRSEELFKYLLQYSKIFPKDLWARKRLALLELQSENVSFIYLNHFLSPDVLIA